MFLYACMHVCRYVRTYVCTHVCMYVCTYVVCTCTRACTHIWLHGCTYTCTCTGICKYVRTYIYTFNIHAFMQPDMNVNRRVASCNSMQARAIRECACRGYTHICIYIYIHSEEYIDSYIHSYAMCVHVYYIRASATACSLQKTRKQNVQARGCNRSKPSRQTLQQELLALDPEA